ncbi:MAG: TolC family outer membrane protein [Caulobacteraceae bacterium]
MTSPRAETLAEAVALAYDSNPTLQAQRASQRALDETWVQARAGYGPTANAQATVATDSNNNRFGGGQFVNGQSQTSSEVVSLTQPIYTGGRVTSQVNAAQAAVLAGRETLRGAEQGVLQGVIDAYVDVRRDTESVNIARDNLGLLRRQLEESRARFEVGEITRTDVAQTEARVAAAQAQLSTAQAQLASSRANYAAIVGRNPGDLSPEPSLESLLPATVDEAFAAAERNNPQVRQSAFAEQQSAARLAGAKAQRRPTFSLQANLGYSGGSLGRGSPFANYSHDISAAAVATVPLFTAGLTSSQIREAAELNNVDRIGIETTLRQALLAVSRAWNALLGARASLVANDQEVRAANIAFEGTRQESRVGLRSTLDVLITEQDLANAERSLVDARHDEYVAATALLVAMGSLSVRAIAKDVPLYDPRANFAKARHAIGWTPWTPAVAAIDSVGAPSTRPPPAGGPLTTAR